MCYNKFRSLFNKVGPIEKGGCVMRSKYDVADDDFFRFDDDDYDSWDELAEPATKLESERKPKVESKPKPEPKAEPKAEQKPTPKSESKADSKSVSKPELKAEPKTRGISLLPPEWADMRYNLPDGPHELQVAHDRLTGTDHAPVLSVILAYNLAGNSYDYDPVYVWIYNHRIRRELSATEKVRYFGGRH